MAACHAFSPLVGTIKRDFSFCAMAHNSLVIGEKWGWIFFTAAASTPEPLTKAPKGP